jgi:ABC-2 type transport system permease protein
MRVVPSASSGLSGSGSGSGSSGSGSLASSADARILGTGYRPYVGPRLGPRHAVWTLARHTFERIMGLRRPARYKLLPVLTLVIAYLPAVAFIGAIALLPSRRLGDFVPSVAQYYTFVTAALWLFAALSAPEALCPDKRSHVLGLYLASPLTRLSYLWAKVGAVAASVLTVTLGPPLLLLAGEALQNQGPRGFDGFMSTLARALVAGVALAVMFTALALVIPSLTDRRAFAAAGNVLVLLGSTAVSNILAFPLRLGDWWLLLGLARLPYELTARIFGRPGLPTPSRTPLPTAPVVVAALLVTLLAGLVTWWRVTRVVVTR